MENLATAFAWRKTNTPLNGISLLGNHLETKSILRCLSMIVLTDKIAIIFKIIETIHNENINLGFVLRAEA